MDEPGKAIEEGRAALARGSWAEARLRFAEALAGEESAEAYEGAGLAARYELDAEAAIDAHERGYRLARSIDDAATAARLAIQLAHDAYAFRGPSEASGWVERAALLIEAEPPSVAAAWVSVLRAQFALADHDPDSAQAESAQGLALAREVAAIDVEMIALSVNGLALVSGGQIEDGMRRLDAAAAAATGGEMTDADSIETVCCHMIDACKLVRDLERANEWCLRVREIATRFADRQMFSICRTAYADVLLWHGDWDRADEELTAAVAELGALRPGRDVDPLARLAELLFAVARWGVGLERIDETPRGGGDLVDGEVERLLVGARGACGPTQLAHELQRRRADLVVARRRLEVRQRLDVPAHGLVLW